MNPYHDHTIILIDIQAPNQLEILTCIRDTFEYMPGWLFSSSVHGSPIDARFYGFNLTMHTFEWWRSNNSYADTMDEDDIVIKDLADISHLLEFVWLNGDSLRLPHTTPVVVDPPKKRKNTDGPNLSQMKKKLSELGNEYYKSSSPGKIKSMLEEMMAKDLDPIPTPLKPSFNPMEFIQHMQPMDMPPKNIFYNDYANPYYGGKSKLYDAVTKKAKEYAEYAEKAKGEAYKKWTHDYAKQAQEEAYKKWQWGWDKIPNSSPYDKPIKAGYFDY